MRHLHNDSCLAVIDLCHVFKHLLGACLGQLSLKFIVAGIHPHMLDIALHKKLLEIRLPIHRFFCRGVVEVKQPHQNHTNDGIHPEYAESESFKLLFLIVHFLSIA